MIWIIAAERDRQTRLGAQCEVIIYTNKSTNAKLPKPAMAQTNCFFFFFTLLEMLSKVIVNGQKLIQKLGFQGFKLQHDENYFFSWDN